MVKDHSARGKKEGNVLFNDALNTFYLRLYGVRHVVKDHSARGKKEGNVLFNDALNTFYLRLYGVRYMVMVKDHSDSERGNPLPPHGLLFLINSKGSFICIIPPSLLHQSWSTGWNEKNPTQWVPREGSIR